MSLYMFRALNAHLQEDTPYTCSIWYCHSRREFVVNCRCTVWVLTQTVHRQVTTNSLQEWQYHMLHVYSVSSWR